MSNTQRQMFFNKFTLCLSFTRMDLLIGMVHKPSCLIATEQEQLNINRGAEISQNGHEKDMPLQLYMYILFSVDPSISQCTQLNLFNGLPNCKVT